VKKEQVKLDVDGDCITVSAELSEEKTYTSPEGASGEMEGKEEAGAKWHRQERVKEYASRCLRMPDTADLQNISAKMEDGVLSVSVAKKAEFAAKQRRIAIE
jgi:HSP20 family protein